MHQNLVLQLGLVFNFVVGGGGDASGMHRVKKVKLNNIKRNSFKERN